jgi:hypothetical protein
LQGAAQAELQAAPAVAQQLAAAPQQFAPGQQVLQALPQAPAPQASQEAQALPQALPQAPQGAAQLPHPPPQGAAQLGAGQQWLTPQQPPRRQRRRPASASLERETNSAARADKASSLRIMMCDSCDSAI